jgi:hypothetical protein
MSTGPYADLCANLARRWTLLTGGHIGDGTVRFEQRASSTGTVSDHDWSLTWPVHQSGKPLSKTELADLIPHEAAHKAFGNFVFALYKNWDGHRYSSALPDWLDEAPAIWMESAASRTRRVDEVRGTKPSLATLVTMEHPLRARSMRTADAEHLSIHRVIVPPCPRCTWRHDTLRMKYELTDIRVNRAGVPDTVIEYFDQDPDKLNSLEKKQYYPLVYSLLRFVHARGGAIAVRTLIERYRANLNAGAEAIAGLPGLPATAADVERAWHRFLAKMPPEVD